MAKLTTIEVNGIGRKRLYVGEGLQSLFDVINEELKVHGVKLKVRYKEERQ